MKQSLYVSILLLLLLSASFYGCKEKNECKAGSGGNLSLKLSPYHHAKPIKGSTIKVKFDTQEFPGEGAAYDIIIKLAETDSFTTITGLTCGDYYIYGTGVDSSLSSADKTVKGGFPFSTEKEEGTVSLTIPVTEVH